MQVEDVSGVRLTTGGTTQQEGHLTVGDGLQREERGTLAPSDLSNPKNEPPGPIQLTCLDRSS